jgi:hypothetical protein
MKPHDTYRTDPWHYSRPQLAEAYLGAFDLKLSSARGLFARRRMGKTEFLLRDLLPAAQERGYLVAYTNLWDNRAAPDAALVTALLDALAPHGMKALLAGLRRPVRKLKAGAKIAGGMEGSIEAELGAADNAADNKPSPLGDLLKRLDAQNQPLLLVIDEAQVLARAHHSDFAHALRAALDVRKGHIKLIFAGSSETTLRTMFARASEPFYNWAPSSPFRCLGTSSSTSRSSWSTAWPGSR